MANGLGKVTHRNGTVYLGELKDDMKHGLG